jgi:Glycosyltransferase family 87
MNTPQILIAACVVASALVLWRRWSPPLVVSLGIGLVLRVAVIYLVHKDTPHDVAVSFYTAGQDVLHGRDPLTSLPKYQWNFLPFSAYLFAAEAKTGLSWQYASKILPVACDVATIALVGQLVRSQEHRRNAQLLYALSPLAILISAWHGQLDPIAVTLGLSALLLARRQQVLAAGLVAGFAVASKSWPILFLPGVLLYVPWRRWWQVAVGVVVVLAGWALVIPLALHDSLKKAIKVILSYRSFSGTWGWTGLLRYAHLTGFGYAGSHVNTAQRIGTILTVLAIVAVLAVFWFWLRRTPEDITVAILLAFLITTAGAGPQYLLWPAALLYALRRPAGYVYLLLASAWTGLFYLYAFPKGESFSQWPGAALEALSIAILLAALASMPWKAASGGHAVADLAPSDPKVPAGRA